MSLFYILMLWCDIKDVRRLLFYFKICVSTTTGLTVYTALRDKSFHIDCSKVRCVGQVRWVVGLSKLPTWCWRSIEWSGLSQASSSWKRSYSCRCTWSQLSPNTDTELPPAPVFYNNISKTLLATAPYLFTQY